MLFLDECHLIWQDACGYGWAPSSQRIELPVANGHERQTYFGALNPLAKEAFVVPFETGNSDYTCAFLEWIRRRYEGKRLIICWDGASYHRSQDMRDYLAGVNNGCAKEEWRIRCVQFAPYAPDQNPIETLWLQAKTFLRKNWQRCKGTFASVMELFEQGLNNCSFDFPKLHMYLPHLQFN